MGRTAKTAMAEKLLPLPVLSENSSLKFSHKSAKLSTLKRQPKTTEGR